MRWSWQMPQRHCCKSANSGDSKLEKPFRMSCIWTGNFHSLDVSSGENLWDKMMHPKTCSKAAALVPAFRNVQSRRRKDVQWCRNRCLGNWSNVWLKWMYDNVWCIFQSCSFLGSFRVSDPSFQKGQHALSPRRFPNHVWWQSTSGADQVGTLAQIIQSWRAEHRVVPDSEDSHGIDFFKWLTLTHLDSCVEMETIFFKSGKWMKMVFSCCYFWGRIMPLGKMWHRRSSFSRRLKAFALCLVWRRCCVPNCCDRCRLMT